MYSIAWYISFLKYWNGFDSLTYSLHDLLSKLNALISQSTEKLIDVVCVQKIYWVLPLLIFRLIHRLSGMNFSSKTGIKYLRIFYVQIHASWFIESIYMYTVDLMWFDSFNFLGFFFCFSILAGIYIKNILWNVCRNLGIILRWYVILNIASLLAFGFWWKCQDMCVLC